MVQRVILYGATRSEIMNMGHENRVAQRVC